MSDNKLLFRFYTTSVFSNKYIELFNANTFRRILAYEVEDNALEDLRVFGVINPLLFQVTPFLIVESVIFVVVGFGEIVEDTRADHCCSNGKYL